MYLWFYEWTLFGAIRRGEHTHGTYDFEREFSEDHTKAEVKSSMIRLTASAASDGADLSLRITNLSESEWPELAAIIPCFNPGRITGTSAGSSTPKNAQFADVDQKSTYFLGPEGLTQLVTRAIHFNHVFREKIDGLATGGKFVFSSKWPTSMVDSYGGLIVRESVGRDWVAGIAWEDYLSAQGHNPWWCMHLSVRVGPLKVHETKTIRGKIYLFQGTKEDLMERFRREFRSQAPVR
jgi:hypothetical protein